MSPEPPSREDNVFDWAARELEWAKDTLRLADSIEGEEVESEKYRLRVWETKAFVRDVLFDGSENYWELPDSEIRGYPAPGIIYAGDIRHSEYVYQDMRTMCCYLPEPTRSAIMASFGDYNIECFVPGLSRSARISRSRVPPEIRSMAAINSSLPTSFRG